MQRHKELLFLALSVCLCDPKSLIELELDRSELGGTVEYSDGTSVSVGSHLHGSTVGAVTRGFDLRRGNNSAGSFTFASSFGFMVDNREK